jgi:excisionase family DNA binding protein
MPKDTVREHISRGGRRYAKIAEAADYMHVNPYTVRAMLADGRLTPYKLGPRIWRVDLNEVDAVMADGGAA